MVCDVLISNWSLSIWVCTKLILDEASRVLVAMIAMCLAFLELETLCDWFIAHLYVTDPNCIFPSSHVHCGKL